MAKNLRPNTQTATLVTLFVAACIVYIFAPSGGKKPPPVATHEPDFALVTIDSGFSQDEMRAAFPGMHLFPCMTVSPFTLPAAASFLTGLLPAQHGLRVDGVGTLDPATPTLATELSKIDYVCGAFLSSYALSPNHGLTNGFSQYEVRIVRDPEQAPRTRTAAEVVDAAVAWLGETRETSPGKQRFVWVHLPAETNTLAQAARLFSHTEDGSRRLVVPFRGSGEDHMFSLDESIACITIAASGNSPETAISPNWCSMDAYSENLMPWYLFRMPPLSTANGMEFDISIPAVVEQATMLEQFFLRQNGHFGEGLIPPATKLRAVYELSPGDADFARRALAALVSTDTNNFDTVSALAAERPGLPVLHHRLGELLFRDKKYIEAFTEFAKADADGYNMIQAVRMMSKCHIAIGNFAPAIDQAENAFLMNPHDAMLRRELAAILLDVGKSLLAQKQYASSADFLNRVIWLEPRNTEGLFTLAHLQLSTGQTNNATAYLHEIQRINPKDPRAPALLKAIGK